MKNVTKSLKNQVLST